MPNAHEMSDFALVVARDAVDRMIDYVASDLPTYEEIVEASMVLIDSRQATEHDHRTRGAWEHHAASMVLDAARTATYPSEPEANGVDPHDGYRLIAERNYADALGLADSLLLAAAGTDQDDWNYGTSCTTRTSSAARFTWHWETYPRARTN